MNARVNHGLLESTILSDADVGDISTRLERLLRSGGESPVRRAYVRSSIYPAMMGHPGTTEPPGDTEDPAEPEDTTAGPEDTTAEPEVTTAEPEVTVRPTRSPQ